MGININGTSVTGTDDVYLNGTALSVGGKVYLNGTQVWRKTQVITDVRQWCVDHYIAVNYNGNGTVQVGGAEPSGVVHTGRGDCNGVPQGWFTAASFSTTGWTNVRIQITSTPGGGSSGVNYDNTIAVGSTLNNTTIGPAYGDSGAYQPTITVTVTLTF